MLCVCVERKSSSNFTVSHTHAPTTLAHIVQVCTACIHTFHTLDFWWPMLVCFFFFLSVTIKYGTHVHKLRSGALQHFAHMLRNETESRIWRAECLEDGWSDWEFVCVRVCVCVMASSGGSWQPGESCMTNICREDICMGNIRFDVHGNMLWRL